MKLLTIAATLFALASPAAAYTLEGFATANCVGTPRVKEERDLGRRPTVEYANGIAQWRSIRVRYNKNENQSQKFMVVFSNDANSHNHIQEWVIPGTDHAAHCFSSNDASESRLVMYINY